MIFPCRDDHVIYFTFDGIKTHHFAVASRKVSEITSSISAQDEIRCNASVRSGAKNLLNCIQIYLILFPCSRLKFTSLTALQYKF